MKKPHRESPNTEVDGASPQHTADTESVEWIFEHSKLSEHSVFEGFLFSFVHSVFEGFSFTKKQSVCLRNCTALGFLSVVK